MIVQSLNKNLVTTLKNKESITNSDIIISTLRRAKAAILTAETAGKQRKELNEKEVTQVLRGLVKKNHSTAEEYLKYGEQERADKELLEASILEEYLPQLLNENDTLVLVRSLISETNNPNIGNIMGQLKKHDGVDMGVASRLVKQELS